VHPFDEPGEWFRCALHAHTTNSDGDLAPELLVRHYEWAGYDVLAISDHWVRTDQPSTPGLLVIPSAELNAIAPAREDDAHVLALGLEIEPVVPPYAGGESFDGWIVLPVLGASSAFAVVGSGFEPRARLQIRASAYFVA